MAATFTAPGVYVQEIPSGSRAITGVSTSLTAFVGAARRGPVDDPRRVSNWPEFERMFGGLWASSVMSQTVRQYFLNGGAEALIVRATNSEALVLNATAEALAVTGFDHLRATVSDVTDTGFQLTIALVDGGGAVIDDGDEYSAQVAIDTLNPNLAAITAAATNHAAPVRLVDALGDAPSQVLAAGATDADADNPGVVQLGTAAASASAQVGLGLSLTATAEATAIELFDHLAITITNSGVTANQFDITISAAAEDDTVLTDADSNPYTVSAAGVDVTTDYGAAISALTTATTAPISLATVGGTPPEALPVDGTTESSSVDQGAQATISTEIIELVADNPGAWGNNLRIDTDYVDADQGHVHLRISEVDADGVVIADEFHYNLTTDSMAPRSMERVLNQESGLVSFVGAEPATALVAVGGRVALAGGADGGPLRITQDLLGSENDRSGMYALLEADLFNILCLPLTSWEADDNAVIGMWESATTFCEQQRAFLLIDPPNWADFATVVDGANGFMRHQNTALYYPRIRVPNPLTENRLAEFPPCGVIAGAMARTDGQRGIWKAPAGIDVNLNGVPELAESITDSQQGQLNQLGVNCLRSFPVYGRVVWGARTLVGADVMASDWKYVPVRRLALYLEESLQRGTRWAVFEPNAEPLWAQLRLSIGSFMQGLFRQGAFQGSSADEAYLVKCDSETTTPGDVDRGIVNVTIGFAPLKPAEFVIIKLQQIAAQAE